MLTKDEHEKLQKAGANARARARHSYFENPYLRAEMAPPLSGLTLEEWTERYEAWNFGWEMEHAMRPSDLSTLLAAYR